MSRELMKLALEELQNARDHIYLLPENEQPLTEEQILNRINAAITVLHQEVYRDVNNASQKCAEQQEPVAWMHTTGTGHVYFRKKPQDKVFNPQPVYTAPPKTKQEPVAWMHNFITNNVITHIPADIGRHPERWAPLYTAPCQTCVSLAMTVMNDQTYHEKVISKREWVGLTLNEAEDFYDKYPDRAELINAIDKFLEEKNT